MNASFEISMYPLNEQYETPILAFIDRLNAYPELRVHTNAMSTQIFGDYDLIFEALKNEMKKVHQTLPKTIFVIKSIGFEVDVPN